MPWVPRSALALHLTALSGVIVRRSR